MTNRKLSILVTGAGGPAGTRECLPRMRRRGGPCLWWNRGNWQQFSLWRCLETLSANFVGYFVEKSNMSQNSSTKCPDKVGDKDTQAAIMRTAAGDGSLRAPRGFPGPGPRTTHLYGALRTQAEPENGNRCLVDIAARGWQSRAMLGEPENQFSLTRAALSTGGRAKSKFLSVTVKKQLLGARS